MNNKIKSDIMLPSYNLEDEKMAFDPIKYGNNYKKEHYWRPCVMFPIEMKDEVTAAAKRHGLSVAALSIQAIKHEIERLDNEKATED